MKKVILIFLKNKFLEIIEFLGKASLVIAIFLVITAVGWTLGYGVTLIFGGYDWFWDLINSDSAATDFNLSNTTVFQQGAAGSWFLLITTIALAFVSALLYVMFYKLPKEFVKWIIENWERAKEEAGFIK